MLYSTGASDRVSPEDDFVVIETADSIASQASHSAAAKRGHVVGVGTTSNIQQRKQLWQHPLSLRCR